jgi:hypothetical protein
VNLSPIFVGWQAFTSAGLPLVGGLLTTYVAGTSTPQASYTTSAGTIANSNPIVLDGAGRPPAEIWLVAGVAYKFILTDSLGLNPLTYDNIAGIGDIINLNVAGNTVLGGAGATLNVSAGAIVVSSGNTAIGGNLTVANNTTLGDASTDLLTVNPSAVSWPNNPTHSGNHTFTGNVSTQGSNTLGDALGDTLTVSGGALKVFSDGRVSGNKLHNIGTVTGTTDQFIASGTYNPTITAITNVSSSGINGPFKWTRVGNVVNVSGSVLIIATTAASTATFFDISLPIASNFVLSTDAAGNIANASYLQNGLISANAINDRLAAVYTCAATTPTSFFMTAQYEIL